MDEETLLSAILRSREVYKEARSIGVDFRHFTEAGQALLRAAAEQYERDESTPSVSCRVLRSQLYRRFKSESMVDSIMDYMESLPTEDTPVNVAKEYRAVRLSEAQRVLASALAAGGPGSEVDEALSNFQAIREGTEDTSENPLRLQVEDFDDYSGSRIPLAPDRLRQFLDGGPVRGHHVVVFGRPDSAKSLFAINQSAKALEHDYTVLYVANEEPPQEITRRLLSRLTDCDIRNLESKEAIQAAIDWSEDSYERWNLLHGAEVTFEQIKQAAARVKPDIVVIDQLPNIVCKEDNRVLQLAQLARKAREIAIDNDCLVISLTQAGGSGEGKAKLSMTDVDWSNTAIQAAIDLLIGIGVDDEMYYKDQRMLSITKNKVNGKRGAFKVWIDRKRTGMYSKRPVR